MWLVEFACRIDYLAQCRFSKFQCKHVCLVEAAIFLLARYTSLGVDQSNHILVSKTTKHSLNTKTAMNYESRMWITISFNASSSRFAHFGFTILRATFRFLAV